MFASCSFNFGLLSEIYFNYDRCSPEVMQLSGTNSKVDLNVNLIEYLPCLIFSSFSKFL